MSFLQLGHEYYVEHEDTGSVTQATLCRLAKNARGELVAVLLASPDSGPPFRSSSSEPRPYLSVGSRFVGQDLAEPLGGSLTAVNIVRLKGEHREGEAIGPDDYVAIGRGSLRKAP